MKYRLLLIIPLLILSSCSKGPKPIDFGHENCHYCKMLIADPKFGAEAVSKTGKTYTYDAIECLIMDLQSGGIDEQKMAEFYTIAFDQPRTLINVNEAIFLISPNLPSPMGAYLSAYSSRQAAKKMQNEYGGSIYTWKEVREIVTKGKTE